MSSARQRLFNIGLVVLSVALVLALAIGADRILGAIGPPPAMPGSMELIFPPHAVQEYESFEFKYAAHINKLGLREREIKPKDSGVFRICAIGDSYTYGWGVDADQTWLRRLEESLNAKGLKVETINMGKPGSGPPDYSTLAKKALPILQPDLVIVAILMGNDIVASDPAGVASPSSPFVTFARALFPNFVRYLQRPKGEESQISVEMPPQVSTAEANMMYARNRAQQFLQEWPEDQKARYAAIDPKVRDAFENGRFNPYMVDLALKAPEVYNGTLKLDDAWFQGAIDAVSKHLKIIADAAAEEGAATVVASMPDGPYVNDHAWRSVRAVGYTVPDGMVDSDAPEQAVREAADRAGLRLVSATQQFKENRSDPGLYFPYDGHLTAKGHQLFGASIAPQVEAIVREAQQ